MAPPTALMDLPDNGEGEYYVVPVIRMEDELLHTDEHPVCGDPTCFCALARFQAGMQSWEQRIIEHMRGTQS